MIEMHGCTPGMSWGLVFLGMSIGLAFGFYLRDVCIRMRFESRPMRDEFPDVPVDKAPARRVDA